MKFDIAVRPNILPWPPMIYMVAALAAYVLGQASPLASRGIMSSASPGWPCCFAEVLLDLWAMATMWSGENQHTPA